LPTNTGISSASGHAPKNTEQGKPMHLGYSKIKLQRPGRYVPVTGEEDWNL